MFKRKREIEKRERKLRIQEARDTINDVAVDRTVLGKQTEKQEEAVDIVDKMLKDAEDE